MYTGFNYYINDRMGKDVKAHWHLMRLHWKLFFPFLGALWLIIGITIFYFVRHEKHRQLENLENRLLNVNSTVVDAYNKGVDLQKTVDFIRLFTNQTTLEPLYLTVYDDRDSIVADNEATTISLRDVDGQAGDGPAHLWDGGGNTSVSHVSFDGNKCMVSLMKSPDGHIRSFAALPYRDEVLDFLSVDPMVWIVVIVLGVLSTVVAYFGARALSKNVYALQDFARAIAADELPGDVDRRCFSKDELGDVSRNLLTLYREKIQAEHEKAYHEHQIGVNVSHELNTPIGIVKGYIDTIVDDGGMEPEQRRRFLCRAKQNVDRLAGLVRDVGMVMRLQDSGTMIERASLDFGALVGQIYGDVRHGHIADNMEFDYDIPGDCRVMGHESLLTNALLNLINNASRHSGGRRISLEWTGTEDGMHRFTFRDDGKGVSLEHLPRLFDLFYRVDTGRARKNGGNGIGLPLVRRIIVAHGGDISVLNAPTGGLMFSFTLPVGG